MPERRFFIGAGTTIYQRLPELGARSELTAEIARMTGLFTAPTLGERGWPGMGYQEVPGFGPDLSATDLKAALRGFLTAEERTPEDRVVFYYTGHGLVEDGEYLLALPETTPDMAGTGVWASELARWLLRGTRVRRMLVVLDTCHAAAAAPEFAAESLAALARLRTEAAGQHIAVITAARPRDAAGPGAFAQAFERAVLHRRTGGHEPPFLPLGGVVGSVQTELPPWQHAQLLSAGEDADRFLPNPRYAQWLHGLDLRTQLDREQRRLRDAELRHHVRPRAQGLDTPHDGVWLFTGRRAALAALSAWLRRREHDGVTRVVTGGPGSGKSAVLSRLTVLADRHQRARVPRVDLLPPDSVPPIGGVDVFIHARRRTAEQVLAGLAAAAGVDAERPGQLLAALQDRAAPLVAVVDAVDEAVEPLELVAETLNPLIRGAPASRLRLIVGTRSHLVPQLAGPVEVVDLDAEAYADPDSVREYARRCLVDLVPSSPYRRVDPAVVAATAAHIGAKAELSFLVALITGRSLAMRPATVDPHDPSWRTGLPRLAAEAMRLDLDERLGTDAGRVRDLLLPLAYAQGVGLPWEDLWAPLASVLSGQTYTNDDLDWLIEHAGFYIVESLDSGHSAYRLYHEALAEHLRAGTDEREVHRTIARVLVARVPQALGGGRDWAGAHPYTRAHLATHAAAGGYLDELVTDAGFLLAADRPRLLAALPAVRTLSARAAARAYERAAPKIRLTPPTEHASYLELAAHAYGAPMLASQLDRPGRAWRTRWASWRQIDHQRVLAGHSGPVTGVAATVLDGRPVAVSVGNDQTVRVWDLETGQPIGTAVAASSLLLAVATGTVNGAPIAVTVGEQGRIQKWRLNARPVLLTEIVARNWPRSVTVTAVDGRPVIVTAGFDNALHLADLDTGEPIGQIGTLHEGIIQAFTETTVNGRPVAVTAGEDGTVRISDLTGDPAGDGFLRGYRDKIQAVTTGLVDGRPVAVVGGYGVLDWFDIAGMSHLGSAPGGDIHALTTALLDGRPVLVSADGTPAIRMWDLTTRVPLGQPRTGHTAKVAAITTAVVEDRLLGITASQDSTVRVWDLLTARHARQPTRSGARVDRLAVAGQPPRAVVTGPDGVVRVTDLDGALVDEPLTQYADGVRALAAATVAGRTVVVAAGEDAIIHTVDLETGEPAGPPISNRHRPVCTLLTVTVDGAAVAVVSADDGSFRTYDLATGLPVGQAARPRPWARLLAAGGPTDRPVVVVGAGRTVQAWNLPTGRAEPAGLTLPDFASAAAVTTVDDRPLVVLGTQRGELVLWRPDQGSTAIRRVSGHPGPITHLAAAIVDGRPVAVSAADYTVRLWDAVSGDHLGPRRLIPAGPLTGLAGLDGDGTPVAVSTSHAGLVRWNLADAVPVEAVSSDEEALAVVSGHGRPFVVTTVDGLLRRRDVATGTPRTRPVNTGDRPRERIAISERNGRPVAVTLDALGDVDNPAIGARQEYWDLNTGEVVHRVHRDRDIARALLAAGPFGTSPIAIPPLSLTQAVNLATGATHSFPKLVGSFVQAAYAMVDDPGHLLALLTDRVAYLLELTQTPHVVETRILAWISAPEQMAHACQLVCVRDDRSGPVLVVGNVRGSLVAYRVRDSPRRQDTGSLTGTVLDPGDGAGITALAALTDRRLLVGRGPILELWSLAGDRIAAIELDAPINHLHLAAPDTVVATTFNGIAALAVPGWLNP
jgi:WD40 repeat protein